ncbi:MAG: Hpt domain-containing protein [Candidatus Omnitrophota bacterium]
MEDFKELFRENTQELLRDFKRDFALLEAKADKSTELKNIHRYAHSMKGLSAMMELNEIYLIAEKLESMLKKIIDCALGLNKNTLLEIKAGFSKIEELVKNG